MAKVKSLEEKRFIPYTISVETEEEHKFLLGLFRAYRYEAKEDCDYFNADLDVKFQYLIDEMEDR